MDSHVLLSIAADKTDLAKEEQTQRELDELKKNTQLYVKRFKKEKRYRRKLQEQLEQETRRRVQMEEALRVTSAETLKRITESLAQQAAAAAATTAASAASEDKEDRSDHESHREVRSPVDRDSKDRCSSTPPTSPVERSAQFNAKVSSAAASDGADGSSVGAGSGGGGNTSPNTRGE